MSKDVGNNIGPINNRQGVPTGSKGGGCRLSFDLFTPTLLSLHIEGTSERTTIPLLTREAAIALRTQLDELIHQMQPSTPETTCDEGECAQRAA